MPLTKAAFDRCDLSWSFVRGVVASARRLTVEQRAELDERVAVSLGDISALDPDDALYAVEVAVEEMRDPRNAQRAEERAERGNFVFAQPGLLGRETMFTELDNVSLATVLNGVDAHLPVDDGR